MRLSSKGRYGVRALFDIAFHTAGRSEPGQKPAQMREIAERAEIPARFPIARDRTQSVEAAPLAITYSTAAAAMAASTALPPCQSMRSPACAASGCEGETALRAKTGMRVVA